MFFTPTEAGGIGAFGGFLFALFRGRLPWQVLFGVLVETALLTSTLFMVLIGALLFANFITTVGMSQALIEFAGGLDVAPIVIVLVIVGIYLVLGCVFESISMILLTVPVFVPLVESLGFDLIWFGIVVVVVTEISLITPPIGINVFVLRGLLPDVPTGRIFARRYAILDRRYFPYCGDYFRAAAIATAAIDDAGLAILPRGSLPRPPIRL